MIDECLMVVAHAGEKVSYGQWLCMKDSMVSERGNVLSLQIQARLTKNTFWNASRDVYNTERPSCKLLSFSKILYTLGATL
jgi:hypothetical protein